MKIIFLVNLICGSGLTVDDEGRNTNHVSVRFSENRHPRASNPFNSQETISLPSCDSENGSKRVINIPPGFPPRFPPGFPHPASFHRMTPAVSYPLFPFLVPPTQPDIMPIGPQIIPLEHFILGRFFLCPQEPSYFDKLKENLRLAQSKNPHFLTTFIMKYFKSCNTKNDATLEVSKAKHRACQFIASNLFESIEVGLVFLSTFALKTGGLRNFIKNEENTLFPIDLLQKIDFKAKYGKNSIEYTVTCFKTILSPENNDVGFEKIQHIIMQRSKVKTSLQSFKQELESAYKTCLDRFENALRG